MEQALVPPQVQYIVDDDGQRTAVVIKWEDYQSLQARLGSDPDLLVGLTELELRALAQGMLSPGRQERLDELLGLNRERELDDTEAVELDELLADIDAINILKARATYTLQRLRASQRD
jgi:hypothetical protein